jgi:anti-sigma factor RsiW
MNSSQPYISTASEHDHELLSCYLDNQLSAAERSDLERRLAQEPALRVALAELRATTEVLRTLAPIQPTRSFTLDATSLRRSQRSFNWIFPFASGLAGIVMLLLASFQLLTVPPATAPAPMAAMASPPIATERTTAEAEREEPALLSAATTESAELQQPEAAISTSPEPTLLLIFGTALIGLALGWWLLQRRA